MKALKTIIMKTILLAASTTHAGFVTGNYLVKGLKAGQSLDWGSSSDLMQDHSDYTECLGHIKGVIDSSSFLYDIPNEITGGQVNAIVGKYLEAHPEQWNLNGAVLLLRAMQEAFPK